MVEIYESRGLARTDAETVVRTMAKYPSFFVDVRAGAHRGSTRRSLGFVGVRAEARAPCALLARR